MTWALLAGAILTEVAGTLALRASEGFSKLVPSLIVVAGYIVSFVLLAIVLDRGLPVGVAYAIWAGIGVALVAILGKLLFDDPLTALSALGIALIIAGVVLVESAAEAH
ncbi:MAG: multidrug efflux SMR transporter [Thermoleophilaceae bacterium]|nr:multidrug efflux SMR transporter [Thermoleophilaceae bacterium]